MSNLHDIVFRQVGKTYQKNRVIDDLNLQILPGERLVLLGPSGCGKSTSLRMIAGLEEVTEGELLMGGRLVNQVPSGLRNVSMVFQNYALYPHMSAQQNITYALRVHKTPPSEIRTRLATVLEILNLTPFADRKPRELSGGQRQRVALARALAKHSDYLLLDEPLSNLDAQLRVQARKELVKIHELYNQTMVYVTHDQVEAMTVGTRIALMNAGKLMMLDTPQQVYHRPANVFTARFIGSPSTNIVPCRFDQGCLRIQEQLVPLPEMWMRQIAVHQKSELYFGIRPENVHLTTENLPGSLRGTVRSIEDYGNKRGVYFTLGDQELVSICESVVAAPGERVFFQPDFSHIHLFDQKTEESIGYPPQLRDTLEKLENMA